MTPGAAVAERVRTTGLACYRDDPPEEVGPPYATFIDPITDPVLLAASGVRRRGVQVDLWDYRDGEDVGRVDEIVEAIEASPTATGYRARVTNVTRLVEEDVVHHVIEVAVPHG